MLKVTEVTSRKDLKKFIQFRLDLYKGCPYFVPDLNGEEMEILSGKNPALEFSEMVRYLCYEGKQIVGRIVGLINHRANEIWKQQRVRFAWLDCIDRFEVAELLINTVMEWARKKGMKEIVGPIGFCDFDHNGVLTQGFEEVGTTVAAYYYPYHYQFIEKMGFVSDALWLEYKIKMPENVPERYFKLAQIAKEKYRIHTLDMEKERKVRQRWGRPFFYLINETYAPLYGYTPLSERQIDYYLKKYMPLLRMDLVTFVVNEEGDLIGAGVILPGLIKEMQATKGKLFPFHWIPLLRKLKSRQVEDCELLLIGVKPHYQDKGVNAVIFANSIQQMKKLGVQTLYCNPVLDWNTKMNLHWNHFESVPNKQRRVYLKTL